VRDYGTRNVAASMLRMLLGSTVAAEGNIACVNGTKLTDPIASVG